MGEREEGPQLDGRGLRVAVVAARYNRGIVDGLVESALRRLSAAGADVDGPHWVPGAFELPAAALALAEGRQHDAVVCLGCVIKGETAHFEYVAGPVAHGLMEVSLRTGVPVAMGVLTTYDEGQARARVEKGDEAAATALEMAISLKLLRAEQSPS